MAAMKTPGVYIIEKNAFPNSVVEVATAVPAFIGYTQFASRGGKSLEGKPTRVTSLAEYHNLFGGAPESKFELTEAAGGGISVQNEKGEKKEFSVERSSPGFLLYHSIRLFYQNGGGPCYIVSVGGYDPDAGIDKDTLIGGIEPLLKEPEPTMVLVPETVRLERPLAKSVQEQVLAHCGDDMRNRIAVLDLVNGDLPREDPDPIEDFRNDVGINALDYAVAYYPWLHTTIVGERDIDFENIDGVGVLQSLIRFELGLAEPAAAGGGGAGDEEAEAGAGAGGAAAAVDVAADAKTAQRLAAVTDLATKFGDSRDDRTKKDLLDKSLRAMSPGYKMLLKEFQLTLNLLPPGPAMAGIYTKIDAEQGVWKAPANVSVNSVDAPAVDITSEQQEDLNVPPSGKSVNAIRTFMNEGVLVWGARTLDGNSLDWRYVSVRRTMIMLEESVKLAAKAFVFANNDANTWVTVKSMIRNFLHGIWKQGGLAGTSPEDAFSVHVGLGETMTSEDILEGILRVTVLVAVTRPAEFIEITFQQQMQKS